MKIRLAQEADRRGVYEAMGYCFNNDLNSIENNIKNGDYNKHEQFVVALNDKEEVISTFAVIPFNMYFEGNVIRFGGIGGVSSLPEHRGEGNISSMFEFSLKYMKDNNMIFSALGPFAFQFYRKMGYEWCYTWQLVSIPINDLKSFPAAPIYRELKEANAKEFNDFRNEVISKMNGPVVRDERLSKEKWDQYKNSRSRVYAACNEKNEILAAMVYHQEGREIKVSELYFKEEIGRQYLLNFLYRHRSMTDSVELIITTDDEVRNILPTPRIKYWHWAYMQGRIVVVEDFLNLIKIEDDFIGSFTIKVNDALASWNNKTFEVESVNNKLCVKESTKEADFEISIQRLSQVAIGHLSGKEALKLNLVKVNNLSKTKLFEKAFSKRTTMLWQAF